MTKDEYGDFVLRYKGCGACFPMYHTLRRFEKMWFTAIQKDVAELEKEKCELLGIIQGKDKAIADLEWQLKEITEDNDYWQKENEELEKENTELKERHTEILEAFASASSGDDFEMAESAREIMEILNIPCYRHGKVVSKLTKAKNHIHRLLVLLTEGKRSYAVIDEARAFLQEESE